MFLFPDGVLLHESRRKLLMFSCSRVLLYVERAVLTTQIILSILFSNKAARMLAIFLEILPLFLGRDYFHSRFWAHTEIYLSDRQEKKLLIQVSMRSLSCRKGVLENQDRPLYVVGGMDRFVTWRWRWVRKKFYVSMNEVRGGPVIIHCSGILSHYLNVVRASPLQPSNLKKESVYLQGMRTLRVFSLKLYS